MPVKLAALGIVAFLTVAAIYGGYQFYVTLPPAQPVVMTTAG